jgi:hypothetical protein
LLNKINDWIIQNKTIGLYCNIQFFGAITYNFILIENLQINHIYSLAVEIPGKGIGTTLLNKMKEISTWVDNDALKFFIKQGFKVQKLLGYSLQKYIPFHKNATFCVWGLSANEIKFLKQINK